MPGATEPRAVRPPLLDLNSALGPRDYITVDGRRFAVLRIDALGLRDRAAVFGVFERIDALEKLGTNATDADEREYEERVRELAAKILPTCPPALLAKQPLGQLVAMGTAFFIYARRMSPLPRALVQLLMPLTPTTAKRSRGSRASTAAATGSSTRRRAS